MQEQSNPPKNPKDGTQPFRSTRHRDTPPDTFDPSKPRLGRRDSEPHSAEITYLYDVLCTNFPNDRTMWDLHHYFKVEGIEIDLQFDVSYFRDLQIPYSLSSFRAAKFDNRVPTMAINILSKSTWKTDIGENVDYCRLLKIPLYVVFPAYHVASALYKPPFLRAYLLQSTGEYQIQELKELTINEEGEHNPDAIIDVTEIVPFRLGLMKLKTKHEGDLSLYRVVLLEPNEFKVLPTELEKEKKRADEAEAENIELKKRLEKTKKKTAD